MNRIKLFIIIFFISVIPLHLLAINFNWEIITNSNDVKDIQSSKDTLYLLTTGGLIIYPLSSNLFQKITVENGLTDHQFTTGAFTARGTFIAATSGGIVSFFQKNGQLITEDYSLKGNEIYSIEAVEDTLWIGCKKLIAVYLYDQERQRYQFRDFFTNFNQDFDTFYQIVYFQHKIWVASNNGLFSAPGNFLNNNLKSAGNWRSYTTSNGLPHNTILSLAVKADSLLIGTSAGLSIYHQENFQNFGNYTVRHIQINESQIFIDNSRTIYHFQNNNFFPQYSTSVNTINDFIPDHNGGFWVSFAEKGLLNTRNLQTIRFNGPVDNILGSLILNSRRELWVTSGIYSDQRAKGFSILSPDGRWKNYRYLGAWQNTASAQKVIEDDQNNMWIGTWNGGMLIIDPDFKFYHFNNYVNSGLLWISSAIENDTIVVYPPDSVRHFLSYTVNAPNFLVVTDFLIDRFRDCIWIITPAVRSGRPIIRYSGTSFGPQAYDSTSWEKIQIGEELQIEGAPAAVITSDIFNNNWIGTDRYGIVSMRFQDSQNIIWSKYTETNNLKNNSCFAIASDQDGYVWFGTVAGLNAYFNGYVYDFREDYQPIGLKINGIFVDSENNKWFATDQGLSLLLARSSPFDPKSWVHFVPKTSEVTGQNIYFTNLPSQEIRGVYVDAQTGDVYCTTLSGLAILRSNPFTTPLKNLDQHRVGPNPLKIAEGRENYIYFRNLTPNCEIKILTSTGRLVRTLNLKNSLDFLGSFARWNCRNNEGRLISSGVYIYMITDEAGHSKTGKFLIIRE